MSTSFENGPRSALPPRLEPGAKNAWGSSRTCPNNPAYADFGGLPTKLDAPLRPPCSTVGRRQLRRIPPGRFASTETTPKRSALSGGTRTRGASFTTRLRSSTRPAAGGSSTSSPGPLPNVLPQSCAQPVRTTPSSWYHSCPAQHGDPAPYHNVPLSIDAPNLRQLSPLNGRARVLFHQPRERGPGGPLRRAVQRFQHRGSTGDGWASTLIDDCSDGDALRS